MSRTAASYTKVPSLFRATLIRDLRLSFRLRGDLVNPLFFFVMVIALFPLALGPAPGQLQLVAPGVIWIAALLSVLISVDSLFRADFEDGSLEQVLVSPQPLLFYVLAKILAHWLVVTVPLLLLTPVVSLMLFMQTPTLIAIWLSLLLGTPTLCLISSVGAALTVALKRGGVLTAIIALPLYIPVLIFGTSAVQAAAIGLPYTGQLAYLGAGLALALAGLPLGVVASLRISQQLQ